MVTKFKLNGKDVKAKEFDYNLLCDMEDIGFNIDNIANKPMNALRGYVALCKNCTIEKAGKEINDHIASGGAIDEILGVMTDKLTNSDFFRGQQTSEEKKDTKD